MGENFQFLKIPHTGRSINKYCHRDNQANNYALQFTSNQSHFLYSYSQMPLSHPPTQKNKTCTYTCVTCPIRYQVLYANFLSCKLRFLNIYMCTNTKYIQHPKRTKQIKRVRCLKFCIMIHSEIPPFIMNSLF